MLGSVADKGLDPCRNDAKDATDAKAELAFGAGATHRHNDWIASKFKKSLEPRHRQCAT